MGERMDLIAPDRSDVSIETGVLPDPLKNGDVYKWAMEQAALIRAGRFDEIDWVNVADEIESVGKSEFRSLKSNLQVLLMHMLKWDIQPQKRSRSWMTSIEIHRVHVDQDLSDNPSLKSKLVDAIFQAYRAARVEASGETKERLETFPLQCPYEWDAIMARPFVLDKTDEDV